MTAPALQLVAAAPPPSGSEARPFTSPLLAGSCTCRKSASKCLACRRWVRTYVEIQQRCRSWERQR
jgi:hypothetical protein